MPEIVTPSLPSTESASATILENFSNNFYKILICSIYVQDFASKTVVVDLRIFVFKYSIFFIGECVFWFAWKFFGEITYIK